MPGDKSAISIRIGDDHHEPHGSSQSLGERVALELRRAQLGLEVEDPALEFQHLGLDVDVDQHVRGASVTLGIDRHFERHS